MDTTVTSTHSPGRASSSIQARTLGAGRLEQVGRAGWVAKGVVYGLMGVIALSVALGDSGQSGEASRSGALGKIAEQSWGGVLLVTTAVGLWLYAAWRLTTALLPGDDDVETWAHRVAYFFSAMLYGFLGWTALSFVLSGRGNGQGQGSGDQSLLSKVSRTLLESTGGQWLLGVVGAGIVAGAGYFFYKAVDKKFLERIDLDDASSGERTVIEHTGMVGWIGRAITVALIGIFVVQAAWTADPSEARGLDAALRETADTTWGAILVAVAAVGLIAYGAFAVVSARHRRLLGP